jgi:biotin transporter BioY
VETHQGKIHNVHVGWPTRVGISFGMAGLLSLTALISFPVPWTPVPFSLMPFGLLIAGVAQRPGWAVLSVAIYLLAGTVGVPIFAEGASGFGHLFGPTAGYLFGFLLVSPLVSWYVQTRRQPMPARLSTIILTALGLVGIGGIATIIRFTGTGTGFADYGEDPSMANWGVGRSVLWVMIYLTVAAALATTWTVRRNHDNNRQSLEMFLVMVGATAILHICGVTVLWLATPLSLISAIVLGSVVFLPFDIIKAGMAVAVSLPFLPAESEHA